MNENRNKIGKFIKKYREEKEMSLRALSEITGISFSHVSKIERGEHTPSKETISIIANKLDLDENELLIMSGYTPNNGIDELYTFANYGDEETKELKELLNDPQTELMFNNWRNMSDEERREVLDTIEYLHFKKNKGKK
ncbi:helix-turn-helix domain-containing protein [Virgibacillus natechei]